MGAQVSAGVLSRLWQLLLKAYDEVRRAPDAAAAGDMALIRLAYAADLPGPEEALKRLQAGEALPGVPGPGGGGSGGGGGAVAAMGGGVTAQARPMTAVQPQGEAAPSLQSFADVMNLIKAKRDIVLQLDVERYVRPISFRQGAIEYEPAPGAPNNLAQRLVGRLKEWTGQPWLVAARGGGGAESAWERQKREALEVRAEVEADPFVRSIMEAFPGTEIISVRNLPPPEALPAGEAPEDDEDE